MATLRVTDLTALTGANADSADQFLIWDASASTHKSMTRTELKAAFTGTGNVATNLAWGALALASNTTGAGNTALGYSALNANTTGTNNTAVGRNALLLNTVGTNSVAVGYNALSANTTGGNNTAVGYNALTANTTGVSNTGVGLSALGDNTTGVQNTAVGRLAGSNITTGTNNTCIGYNATASAVGASNEITLGNSSVATIRAQVTTITSLSDARDKKNIRPLDLGLDFVLAIEPKWFEWNMRPEVDPDGNVVVGKVDITEAGFIAQQLQEAVAAHEGAEALDLVFDSNPDRLEATPGKLMPVFVKAFHDIHARLQAGGL